VRLSHRVICNVLDYLIDRYVEQVGLSHRQFCARYRVITQKVRATKWLTNLGFQVQITALVRYIIIVVIAVAAAVVDADPSGCTDGVGIRPLAC